MWISFSFSYLDLIQLCNEKIITPIGAYSNTEKYIMEGINIKLHHVLLIISSENFAVTLYTRLNPSENNIEILENYKLTSKVAVSSQSFGLFDPKRLSYFHILKL